MATAPVRLLVVDDEEDLELLIRQKFRRRIRKGEFDFVFARNGQEALDRLAENPDIHLVLSDINMPVMDGLALLSKLEYTNPDVQAVIVSAYGDMENIRTAMNRGAFDFVTKPINFDDLEITIEKTLSHIRALETAQEARDRLVLLKRELDVAQQVQMSALPKEIPSSATHDVQALMIPAREVGGDFYDFFPLSDEQIGLVIADVSGKGIPAALFTLMTRTLLKGTARDAPSSAERTARDALSPADCLNQVNELLAEDNETLIFITLFYGVFDLRNGVFRYSNGGHNPPRLVRNDSRVEELPVTKNVVLGVAPGHEYHNGEIRLAPGDALFLYTDGVTEAQNTANEEFGEERLDAILASHGQVSAHEIVTTVVDEVQAFAGDAPQSDDITCLAMRFTAPFSSSTADGT